MFPPHGEFPRGWEPEVQVTKLTQVTLTTVVDLGFIPAVVSLVMTS